MRRPHTATSRKRNRTRWLKKGPGRRTFARKRLVVPRLPVPDPESVARQLAAAAPPAANAAGAGVEAEAEAAASHSEEMGAGESARCGFGAVRVGPLLGRLRLHLQTERFLAVHRGDAAWEEACAAAGLALAEIAEGMTEAALDAPLPPQRAQSPHVPGAGALRSQGEQSQRAAGTAIAPASAAGVITSLPQEDKGATEPPNQIQNLTADSSSLQKAHPFLGMTPSSGADVAVVRAPSRVAWGTRKTGTAALAACGAELERGAR